MYGETTVRLATRHQRPLMQRSPLAHTYQTVARTADRPAWHAIVDHC